MGSFLHLPSCEMKVYTYTADFSGTQLKLAFQYPETYQYFRSYITVSETIECDREYLDKNNYVYVPEEDYDFWNKEYNLIKSARTEYDLSLFRISDKLTETNQCVYHAVAFLWRNKAWLISADSGVGKSTQYLHWSRLFPGETEIINGDKPVLQVEDATVTVHPSPWKGKEGWGNDHISAPLGGIILLRRGMENKIEKLQPYEAGLQVLSHFLNTFESEEVLHHICFIENAVLTSVPVWILTNIGDEASCILTHETLTDEVEKSNGL